MDYGNRKVIATVDLPNRLSVILKHLAESKKFDIHELIYQHTLFPLYAPFVPEKRRLKCLQWMEDNTKGSVHLALGIAATRLKQVPMLRYCPQCLSDQLGEYGEYYWRRAWQVTGVDVVQSTAYCSLLR